MLSSAHHAALQPMGTNLTQKRDRVASTYTHIKTLSRIVGKRLLIGNLELYAAGFDATTQELRLDGVVRDWVEQPSSQALGRNELQPLGA